MTQLMPPPAPSEIEAFIGQVVTGLSATFPGVLVNVGRKPGLYQTMAELRGTRRGRSSDNRQASLGACRRWRSQPEVYRTC